MTVILRAPQRDKDISLEKSERLVDGLHGLRRVSHAHVLLSRHPEAEKQAQVLGLKVGAALGGLLKLPLATTVRLAQHSLSPSRSLSKTAAFALLELSQVGSVAVLEVELGLAVSMIEKLTGAQVRTAPVSVFTRIEEAAFSYVVLAALQTAREHGYWQNVLGARLVSVHTDRAEVLEAMELGQHHVAAEVAFTGGGLSGQARLVLPVPGLERAFRQLPGASPREMSAAVSEARISLAPRMGGVFLTAEELERLMAGDVVVYSALKWDGQVLGAARMLSSSFCLYGALEGSGFRVSEIATHPRRLEMPMSKTLSSSLPVEVEIELTKVRMPLSELATLQPGVILPLRVTPHEPVLLRVGDRAIAQAELVEIDGQLGARIIEMIS